MTLTITDLFAGAGGSSTGMATIPGIKIRIAANHWKLACEIHNANHPDTDHAAVDLHQENPAYFPKTDVLWASPECKKWSQANGSRLPAIDEGLFEDPLSDDAANRSRLLMFDVLRFVEYYQYKIVIVENVVDIATAPKYRTAWDEWRRQLAGLGYHHRVLSLNAMHAQAFGPPAPQSRDRIYIVAWRKGDNPPDLEPILRPQAYCPRCDVTELATQSWKNGRTVGKYRQQYVYVHPACGTVVEPGYLPAAVAIDWSDPGTPIAERAKPLADKTIARIAAGIARYWSPLQVEAAGNTYDAADFAHPRHGQPDAYYRAWPVTDVFKTLHTSASKALAVPVEGRDGKEARPLAEPGRTQTTRLETGLTFMTQFRDRVRDIDPRESPLPTIVADGANHGLVELPFVAELRGGGSDARTVTDPASTFTAGGNHHALVMTNNHHNRARTIDEAAPTFTTAGGGGQALITRHYGIVGGDPARHTTPAGEQLRTLTANGGNMSLLTPYYGTAGSARPATDPVGTLTTHDRYALVHRHNTGGAEVLTPAFEELRTITTAGHQSILRSTKQVTAADLDAAKRLVPECLFRMFKPMECAAGMAFPATYDWQPDGKKPSNRDLVKAIGNAVSPPCARDILGAIVQSFYGQELGAVA